MAPGDETNAAATPTTASKASRAAPPARGMRLTRLTSLPDDTATARSVPLLMRLHVRQPAAMRPPPSRGRPLGPPPRGAPQPVSGLTALQATDLRRAPRVLCEPGRRLKRRQRTCEQETLPELASEPPQLGVLGSGLDALGQRAQAERL